VPFDDLIPYPLLLKEKGDVTSASLPCRDWQQRRLIVLPLLQERETEGEVAGGQALPRARS
jgi:hypothetical protein